MFLFKKKIKEYTSNLGLILSDKFNYNQSEISVSDIEEIDDFFSLYIMYKNEVIGNLEKNFLEKIDDLSQEIGKEEIFELFEDLSLAISEFKRKRSIQ